MSLTFFIYSSTFTDEDIEFIWASYTAASDAYGTPVLLGYYASDVSAFFSSSGIDIGLFVRSRLSKILHVSNFYTGMTSFILLFDIFNTFSPGYCAPITSNPPSN